MMTPEAKQKLKGLLLAHESYKQFPYTDTTGHLSIGIGRNLTDRGISATEAFYLLDDDIAYFSDRLTRYLEVFKMLDENRQLALIDICFNVGLQGFLNFKEMIAALEAHDFTRAANEILDSKAAKQNVDRYIMLANVIRTGEL